MSGSFATFVKDPDAVLDYKFDWKALTNGNGSSDWLQSGETISTKTISADTGITVGTSSITDSSTSVTVWISAGTAGTDYAVKCKITTTGSRTDERTMMIAVRNR